MATVATNLNIGSDDFGYFLYEKPGIILFRGSYTRCLIILGSVSLGNDIDRAIRVATSFDTNKI